MSGKGCRRCDSSAIDGVLPLADPVVVVALIVALAAALTAISVGIWFGTFGRFGVTTVDSYDLRQAGTPSQWWPSPPSQYRDAELLWWCREFALGAGWLAWTMIYG